jgi:nucleotide-binding universal stress UspA family protein
VDIVIVSMITTAPTQIVLATDFSPSAMAAVPITGRLARIFKAKVTLLHVFQYVPKHRYPIPVEWMVEIIRRDVRSKLAEAKRILHDAGLETEVMVLEDGIPAEQILTFVKSCAAPLLVMGTHAAGGMERFILGSTAEEVLRQAYCPVVTVGPRVSSVAQTDIPTQKILYATDFSEASLAAASLVDVLRRSTEARLRILHVSQGHTPEMPGDDDRFDGVRKVLGTTSGEECVTLHETHVAQAVIDEAERYSADLVILGVKRASAFTAHAVQGTAFQIIAASPCPVLTTSS